MKLFDLQIALEKAKDRSRMNEGSNYVYMKDDRSFIITSEILLDKIHRRVASFRNGIRTH